MLLSSYFASANISTEQILEFTPYIYPAAAFLLGWLLTMVIMRKNETASLVKSEERLNASKEANDGLTKRVSELEQELRSSSINEAQLMHDQGHLKGQLHVKEKLLSQLGVSQNTAEPLEQQQADSNQELKSPLKKFIPSKPNSSSADPNVDQEDDAEKIKGNALLSDVAANMPPKSLIKHKGDSKHPVAQPTPATTQANETTQKSESPAVPPLSPPHIISERVLEKKKNTGKPETSNDISSQKNEEPTAAPPALSKIAEKLSPRTELTATPKTVPPLPPITTKKAESSTSPKALTALVGSQPMKTQHEQGTLKNKEPATLVKEEVPQKNQSRDEAQILDEFFAKEVGELKKTLVTPTHQAAKPLPLTPDAKGAAAAFRDALKNNVQ